ncbi:MAG: hypothetical protein IMF05_13040 [Proteobacteria bacterium]|nr:hypothetical protein [Pseudomonadota bacterium]
MATPGNRRLVERSLGLPVRRQPALKGDKQAGNAAENNSVVPDYFTDFNWVSHN